MPRSAGECFKQALETSTVKGVSRAYKEKNVCLKCSWFFVIILIILLIVYSIANLFVHYLQYPKETNISEEPTANWTQDFLLCNRNPVSKAVAGVTTYDEYKQNVKSKLQGKDVPDASLKHMMSLEAYLQNVGTNNAAKLGQSHDELLVDCRVTLEGFHGSVPCSSVYQNKFVYHPKYSNCFKFAASKPVKSVLIKGSMDRVKTSISLDTVGVVEPALLMSFRKSEGNDSWGDEVVIPVGSHARVDVKSTVHKRLKAPYGDCVENHYAPEVCHQQCLHDAILSKCACALKNSTTEACVKLASDGDVTAKRLKCMETTMNEPMETCGCPRPCQEVTHTPLTTFYPWTKQQQLAFYIEYLQGSKLTHQDYSAIYDPIIAKIEGGNPEAEQDLAGSTLVAQYFASVEVNFDPTQMVMEQTVGMTLTDVLGAPMGGLLNLAGISLVFFWEFIDLFVKLCMTACCKSKDKIGDEYAVKT